MGNFITLLFKNISKYFGRTFEEDIQQFAQSFSSMNFQLRGDLLLFGALKGNLFSLTFDQYKNYLSRYPGYSAKNVYSVLKNCTKCTFLPSKDSFKITIYSEKLGITISQDAREAYYYSIKRI
jgi:hypothetical protein